MGQFVDHIMSKRNNLVILLSITGAISIAYKLGVSYLFYPAIIFGGLTVIYAFHIKCPNCHRRQVFRGVSIFDLGFPKSNCYNCGSPLNKNAEKKVNKEKNRGQRDRPRF